MKNHKRTAGVSYIELLVAMALFAIALLAILPTLSQAARNMTFAQETYAGHLQAGRVMLTVRNALMNNEDPKARVAAYVAGDFEYSVWIFGQNAQDFHSYIAIDAHTAISGINATMQEHASTIVVVVWGEDGQIIGRSIGMMH
ncbi:MAG: type II secretion system GspH family protein [Defluviitaleaceae bacterium]|nr:type II secretion system GspH family protein [Defluviitaleaceae bacterium]